MSAEFLSGATRSAPWLIALAMVITCCKSTHRGPNDEDPRAFEIGSEIGHWLTGEDAEAFILTGDAEAIKRLQRLHTDLLLLSMHLSRSMAGASIEDFPQATAFRAQVGDALSSRVARIAPVRRSYPSVMSNPRFSEAFLRSFGIESVSLSIERIEVMDRHEDELEVYHSFGYRTGKEDRTSVGRWDHQSTPVSTQGDPPFLVKIDQQRSVRLPTSSDLSLFFAIHEDDGEFLRTETHRLFTELQEKSVGAVALEVDSERVNALRLGFVDWLPLVNWAWQFTQWGWSQFTRTDLLSDWTVTLKKEHLYAPESISDGYVASIECQDVYHKTVDISVASTGRLQEDIAALLNTMRSGSHLIMKYRTEKPLSAVSFTLDIRYSLKERLQP